MSEAPDAWPRSTVLVEVDLPQPETFSPLLIGLIGSLRVVLLGCYRVPEQTTAEQARDQQQEEAVAAMQDLATAFRAAGAEVDARVVFTADPLITAERVADEERCDAVIVARPLRKLERVLVPLRGPQLVRRTASFLADLVEGNDVRLTLVHVREAEEEEEDFATWVLEEARETLVELDVEPGRIETRVLADGDPAELVLEAAQHHDVVVLGEREPSAAALLFGTFSERVVREMDAPVFVIRGEH